MLSHDVDRVIIRIHRAILPRVTPRQTSSGWTADTSDFGKLLHCDMD